MRDFVIQTACFVLIAALTGCDRSSSPAPPSQESDLVSIEFVLSVPDSTPENATVYIAGNRPQFGGEWNPSGHALTRDADGKWKTTIFLPPGGGELQYKFTLGAWQTVERDEKDKDIPNRTLRIDSGRKELRVEATVARWANGGDASRAAPRAHTLSGDIRSHNDFASKYLQNKRQILVYLPPGYDTSTDRYPVLYMHDGQNVFDDATSHAGEWHADETAGELIASGKIPPIIIVAVANAGEGRVDEYTPSRGERHGKAEGGKAADYAKFLLEEVKPFIDSTYRTKADRENTGVCGSSLGGLVSIYIASTYPDRVGLCGALSPSLWWNEVEAVEAMKKDPTWVRTCRIWLDMGTREDSADAIAASPLKVGWNVYDARHFSRLAQTAGAKFGTDFYYFEVPDGEHNEQAWAARFGKVLEFLFAGKKP
jgi:predicted alpha/beta superfamily hydrolase